jgi:hypothetical protein
MYCTALAVRGRVTGHGSRGRNGNHFAPLNGREEPKLTLEMESLLVHGDGECAVVLVINADYSALG